MAADFEQVKQNIADTIYENGEELITGQVMQDRLLEMVSVTEEAINDVTIDQTVNVTVNNTTGTPSGSASFQNNQFSFEFNGIKGETGNSGYTGAAGELEVVNNLNSDDATAALSAYQGKVLDGKVTQLGQNVDEDITDLETATNTKIGGPIVLKEDVSWTARSFEHPISIPRGCTISVKLIADGVTPSSGIRVRVKYVDDTLVDFTSSPLTSIGATATITAAKNVKSITFYNNDAYTSASVKITAPFSVVGTMNTDTIRGTRIDFIKLDEQFNLFVYSDALVDAYIDGGGGYELNNTGLVASPFIPVEQNKTYYIGGKVLAKYYAFYDEDKTYISGDNSTSGYMTQITAPANAAFIRFTGQVATYQSIVFSLNPLADTTNKYTTKDNIVLPIDISAEELNDVELLDAGNIIDRTRLTVGAYISATDGNLTPVPAQPQWVATDWCDIDATKKYTWFKLADFYAAFYDEKKAFIRGYSTEDRLPNPVTPPVNAKYARFTISNTAPNAYGVYPVDSCWCAADSENTQPNEFKSFVLPKEIFTEREFGTNPCDYTGNEISVFNKLLCVGDSLMYGAENVATGSPYITTKEPLYNIPSFIKKMAGIDTTNAAHSGYTAQQWLADFSDDDLSGHDACIIQIGVNNWLTWADDEDADIETFKSTLGDIIDLVISQNSYNDGGVLKNKIKVFVATQFPSKSYLKNTDGVSLDVLNEAIREVVAGRSDCFLLDMAVYSHSNDKLAFNRGHLTAIGYRQVAQDYCGIISKFVHDNLDLFVDVPFVGTNATQFQYSPTQI